MAYAWYIDGTFKIVKEPMKQLVTIHIILNIAEQRVSVPVCFVLMSRRRKIDYIAILKKIIEPCKKFVSDKSRAANMYDLPVFCTFFCDF